MKCKQCGNDVIESAQFCGSCGASVSFDLKEVSFTHKRQVSFTTAVKLGFSRYFDFRGRSTRAEYWWWALFAVLADVILSAVDIMVGTFDWETGNGLISGLFGLGILIPGLALGARRLHDINRTGWWQLMGLGIWLIVPVIVLFVWSIKPSDEGTNKHGPAPRHPTAQ